MKRIMRYSLLIPTSAVALLVSSITTFAASAEPGFITLFDGQSLNGWKLLDKHGEGYGVKEGVIYCGKKSGGRLFTEKEYGDFVFRFEFKLDEASNNGVGIRSPLEGDPAYAGMEIQILDDYAPGYKNLRPAQYHGSIYDVIPAKRGALKKAGEWNEEEITAQGRNIKVVLNGQTIVDADLNSVTSPSTISKHPGLFKDKGHIGFLGHNDYIEIRNLRVKELASEEKDNTAPEGF